MSNNKFTNRNKNIFFNDIFLLKEKVDKFMNEEAWLKLPALKHEQEKRLKGFRAELTGIYNDYKKFEAEEIDIKILNKATDRLKNMTEEFHNFLIDHDLKHEKEFDELLENLELVINHYQRTDKKAKYKNR